MSAVRLLPWQQRVAEMLIDRQNRHYLIVWGDRSGKTAIWTEVVRRLTEREAQAQTRPSPEANTSAASPNVGITAG